MSDLQDVGRLLEAAEQAAAANDLASANELLRDIARIQEAALGPLHPDLANTLNNLAIVAEKSGRVDDAERFYRRSVAIATASLPADHPMVAASRENLQDFCRAHGLLIDPPARAIPAAPSTGADSAPSVPGSTAPAPTPTPAPTSTAAAAPASAPAARATAARADSRHMTAESDNSVRGSDRPQAVPRKSALSFAKAAIGIAVAFVALAFFLRSRDTSTPPPTTATPPQTAERTAPAPHTAERTEPASTPTAQRAAPNPADAAPPASTREQQSPIVAPRSDNPTVSAAKLPTSTPASSAIALITTELCRTFSTRDTKWTCDPAVDPVSPGPIVLYTRVTSPADAVVVHRWYRGDTLRQSVNLHIRASATEGYRTYSRQTVSAGEWRVEVRSVEGALLHEQRFVVR